MTENEAANTLREIVKEVRGCPYNRPDGTVSSATFLIMVGGLKQLLEIADLLDEKAKGH